MEQKSQLSIYSRSTSVTIDPFELPGTGIQKVQSTPSDRSARDIGTTVQELAKRLLERYTTLYSTNEEQNLFKTSTFFESIGAAAGTHHLGAE